MAVHHLNTASSNAGGVTRRQALAAGAGLLAAAATTKLGCSGRFGAKPNVVVFLSDALRADALGCYGNPRPASPFIDSFAKDGLVFEHCMAAASWTKPACTSLFTSTLPPVHGLVMGSWCDERQRVLSRELDTFETSFAAGGYNTAWFLGNPQIRREFGLGRGFEHYQLDAKENPARQVGEVIQWLKDRPAGPFMLFVHVIDPHDPYTVSEEEFLDFNGKPISEALATLPADERELFHDFHILRWQDRINTTGRLPLQNYSPEAIAYARSLYETEVRRVDGQFARLYRAIESEALLEDTLILVTADHGHAFNEHGVCYHGNNVYDNEVHIPLIMQFPRKWPGARIAQPCSQIDIAPTLLALAGQDPLPRAQGRSLLNADGSLANAEDTTLYSYHTPCMRNRESWYTAMRDGHRKLIFNPNETQLELYDVLKDPGEETNLLLDDDLPAAEADRLTERLYKAKAEHFAAGYALPATEWFDNVPAGHNESLEALGYL